MENATGKSYSGDKTNVRVVVVGDHGTGKSSLIVATADETFSQNVPPVLPPTCLPDDFFPDGVPITIIDTSASLENRSELDQELRLADAVVLTYACDQPATLDRLSTFWLPELRQLEVKVPVIVVSCKLDARKDTQVSFEQMMSPIMQQFPEIETCLECSASDLFQFKEVFYYAQKAVLHPIAPLFDQETQAFKPRCVEALQRIFILCDHDKDSALCDKELNDFQVKCFDAPMQPSEIQDIKRTVQKKLPEGVNDCGVTLAGFLYLHATIIEKGCTETIWTVLRKFGYDDEIKLRDDLLPVSSKQAPDQSLELINEAVEFLKEILTAFDLDVECVAPNMASPRPQDDQKLLLLKEDGLVEEVEEDSQLFNLSSNYVEAHQENFGPIQVTKLLGESVEAKNSLGTEDSEALATGLKEYENKLDGK